MDNGKLNWKLETGNWKLELRDLELEAWNLRLETGLNSYRDWKWTMDNGQPAWRWHVCEGQVDNWKLIWKEETGNWKLETGNWKLELRDLELGTWNLKLETWDLKLVLIAIGSGNRNKRTFEHLNKRTKNLLAPGPDSYRDWNLALSTCPFRASHPKAGRPAPVSQAIPRQAGLPLSHKPSQGRQAKH